MSSLSGGRDPFDDPFFTRPFRDLFPSSNFSEPERTNVHMGFKSSTSDMPKGPVIQEVFSDDEEDGLDCKMSSDEPSVEHPDNEESCREDETTRPNDMDCRSDDKNDERRQSTGPRFSFRRVAYGGVNGPYRSSSVTRTTRSDGIHSVTRTLNPEGKVNTKQSLHNLNEDELAGFEENWIVRNFTNRRASLNLHNNRGGGNRDAQDRQSIFRAQALPSFTPFGEQGAESGIRASQFTSGSAKKVVRIPID